MTMNARDGAVPHRGDNGFNGNSGGVTVAVGPDGRHLSLDDLPSPDTKRWVMRRKAEVIAAIRGGLLTFEEACQRYSISAEELQSWQRLIDQHGVRGLRATRLQDYRSPGNPASKRMF